MQNLDQLEAKAMLVKGSDLNLKQRQLVLSAFVHRWTKENPNRKKAWAKAGSRPTVPLETDEDWLKQHAFHFVKNGSQLSKKHNHCEPVYIAD